MNQTGFTLHEGRTHRITEYSYQSKGKLICDMFIITIDNNNRTYCSILDKKIKMIKKKIVIRSKTFANPLCDVDRATLLE